MAWWTLLSTSFLGQRDLDAMSATTSRGGGAGKCSRFAHWFNYLDKSAHEHISSESFPLTMICAHHSDGSITGDITPHSIMEDSFISSLSPYAKATCLAARVQKGWISLSSSQMILNISLGIISNWSLKGSRKPSTRCLSVTVDIGILFNNQIIPSHLIWCSSWFIASC